MRTISAAVTELQYFRGAKRKARLQISISESYQGHTNDRSALRRLVFNQRTVAGLFIQPVDTLEYNALNSGAVAYSCLLGWNGLLSAKPALSSRRNALHASRGCTTP